MYQGAQASARWYAPTAVAAPTGTKTTRVAMTATRRLRSGGLARISKPCAATRGTSRRPHGSGRKRSAPGLLHPVEQRALSGHDVARRRDLHERREDDVARFLARDARGRLADARVRRERLCAVGDDLPDRVATTDALTERVDGGFLRLREVPVRAHHHAQETSQD